MHKWGCSLESVRRYVSSPLIDVGNAGILYTTGKTFKAFRAEIDTVVTYSFFRDKLDTIIFNIQDKRSNALLQSIITKELTERYGMLPEEKYVGEHYEHYSEVNIHIDGYILRTWDLDGFTISMRYYNNDKLSLFFAPRPWQKKIPFLRNFP